MEPTDVRRDIIWFQVLFPIPHERRCTTIAVHQERAKGQREYYPEATRELVEPFHLNRGSRVAEAEMVAADPDGRTANANGPEWVESVGRGTGYARTLERLPRPGPSQLRPE